MQIGVTESLRKFLGVGRLTKGEEYDLFFCWEANRVSLDGRIMLVLCNAANRFCCVSAMRATDWRHFGETCASIIRKAMSLAGFCDDAIVKYLRMAGAFGMTRTHGRRPVAGMNTIANDLYFHECERGVQFQEQMTRFANNTICRCATREGYGKAWEWMEQDLLKHGIDPYGTDENADSSEGPRLVYDSKAHAPNTGGSTQAKGVRQTEPQMAGSTTSDANCCSVCGGQAKVSVGNVPFCLDCHNRFVKKQLGIQHMEHDNTVFVALDPEGKTVEFAVERLLLPHLARWVAREMLYHDDSRPSYGYEGIEVSVYASPMEDSNVTLGRLCEKAQEALCKPSTRRPAFCGGNAYAEEKGWAGIRYGENGEYYLLIDGQRYSGEEFLQLLSCYEGFNLRWSIGDAGDPLFG